MAVTIPIRRAIRRLLFRCNGGVCSVYVPAVMRLGTEARSEVSMFVGGIAESTSGPCVGRDPKESLFEVDRWRPVSKGFARTHSIHVAPSAQHTQHRTLSTRAAYGSSGLDEVGYAKPVPLYVMLHRELSTKHGVNHNFVLVESTLSHSGCYWSSSFGLPA
ncbi:hypothetical protein VTG60DRAFT_2520 [Thermothelomyces hinnuleus]